MSNYLTSAAVLLANTYSSSGEHEKAFEIKNQLRKSGAKKKVGLSWTVIDGEIYVRERFDLSFDEKTNKI